MKLFRYRKPSINRLLGISRIKARARKITGLSTIDRFTKVSRIKQSAKQKVGIYGNPVLTVARQTAKGRFLSFLGISSGKK